MKKNFCAKRNASIPLGIEPRTFRLSVECFLSFGGSTQVFSQNLFTPVRLQIYHKLFTHFFKSFQWIDYVRKVVWNIRSSDDRAFDRQSKGLGFDTQRSGSVLLFSQNFFFKIYWEFHLVLNDVKLISNHRLIRSI